MMTTPQGRPPFRADHVGSLLRPPALRQAFRDHHGQAHRRCRVHAHPGRLHPRRREDAGRRRAEGRDRRRIPPRLLLGALRRADRRLCDQARGVQVPRRSRPRVVDFTAPYAERQAQAQHSRSRSTNSNSCKGITKATPKITLPAPSTMHFYRAHRFRGEVRLSGRGELFCRSRPHLPRGDRRSREGRLQAISSSTRSRSRCSAIRRSASRSRRKA